MASITLAGTLLDPNGDLAVGDQIRFTHSSTTGRTVKGAVSVITINPAGTYTLPLQFGLVLVEYKDVRSTQFKNLGVATVNSSNPATSIPELLNALVPVSSAELIEFQGILADAVAAKVASEAAAATLDFSVFDNIAAMKTSDLPLGKLVKCKRYYAGAGLVKGLMFDIKASGTNNGINHALNNGNFAILSTGTSVDVMQGGADGGGVVNDSPRINAVYEHVGENGTVTHGRNKTFAIIGRLLVFANTIYDGTGCKLVPHASIDHNVAPSSPIQNGANIANGVTIKNFEIDGTGKGFDWAILLTGCSNVTVKDNYIHDIGNILGDGDTLEAGFGVYVQGSGTSDIITNINISNNRIKNIYGFGIVRGDFIYTRFCDRVIIQGNQCDGAKRMGIALTDYATNVIIDANNLTNTNAAGIDLESNTKVGDLNRVVISNNTISRFGIKPAGETGLQFFGIDLHDTAQDVSITGNVISQGDPDNIGNTTLGIKGLNNAKNAVISNNIFADMDGVLNNFAGNGFSNFVFSSNVATNIHATALSIAILGECCISNNFIESTGTTLFTVGAGNMTITGNHFTTARTRSLFIAQSTNANIVGNTFVTGSTLAGDSRDAAIYARATSSTINTGTICNNHFSGANGGTRAIQFETQTGGSNKYIVRDNIYSNGITDRIVGYNSSSQFDLGGVSVTSPNGTEYIIQVDNAGAVSTSLA
jgi:hypothetical protein